MMVGDGVAITARTFRLKKIYASTQLPPCMADDPKVVARIDACEKTSATGKNLHRHQGASISDGRQTQPNLPEPQLFL